MFVRNACVDSWLLKNKGTFDFLKEYHSVAGCESSLQPLAGSKKSSYMRSPLEPPWFNVVGSDGEARYHPSGPTLKARGQGRSLSTEAFPTAERIHASTHRNIEKDRWTLCCKISSIDR